MSSGSYIKGSVKCPYYKADENPNKISCEGVIPGGASLTHYFTHRADYLAQLRRCCADYWKCPLCEALDRKYMED